jgi:cytidine deaminase
LSISSARTAPELIEQARLLLPRAYARYSRFPVAAVVLDELGHIYGGVNVENASYGLTMCAERVAIFSAIAAGAKALSVLALTARDAKPVAPCGACRQVMAEFFPVSAKVYSDGGGSRIVTWTVGELLPDAFGSVALPLHRSA